jgi:hypothetical protein
MKLFDLLGQQFKTNTERSVCWTPCQKATPEVLTGGPQGGPVREGLEVPDEKARRSRTRKLGGPGGAGQGGTGREGQEVPDEQAKEVLDEQAKEVLDEQAKEVLDEQGRRSRRSRPRRSRTSRPTRSRREAVPEVLERT